MTTRTNRGFTLIEVLVSIILAAILAIGVGMGVARLVEGHLFVKTNAAALQKGQMAATRIALELKNTVAILPASNETSVVFNSFKDKVEKTRILRLNGGNVELSEGDGNFFVLTDQVAPGDGLRFQYYVNYEDPEEGQSAPASARILSVRLRLIAADGVVKTFTQRIVPRNIQP